jgi:enoyl reductase-like protein
MESKLVEFFDKVNFKAIAERTLQDRQVLNRQLEFLMDGVTKKWQQCTHEELVTQLRFAEFDQRVHQNILHDKIEREYFEQGKQEFFPDLLSMTVNILL